MYAEPGASAPGDDCVNVMWFDLVPTIPHPADRAGDGAGGVTFVGARGVDKPACTPR